MTKETFDTIIFNLDIVLADCKTVVGDLSTGSGVTKEYLETELNYAQLKALVKLARKIQCNTDKLYKDELYHILGMGNMNAQQTMQFCKRIRDIGIYRSYIKGIASINLPELPKVPQTATYKCSVLGVELKHEFN